MSILEKHRIKYIALVLSVASAAAIAGSVTINGFNYACEHECILEVGPAGFTLSDSGGGWIRKTGPAKKPLPPRI
jgi:hypothetical protein